jgi:hypothetical protein
MNGQQVLKSLKTMVPLETVPRELSNEWSCQCGKISDELKFPPNNREKKMHGPIGM